MRRIYKISLGLLAVAIATAIAGVGAIIYYQAHLADAVVARFNARTGLQLVPAQSRILFSTHLVIQLDQPSVLDRTQRIVKLRRLNLLCSYHALLFEGGLPLYAIVLDHPQLRLFKPQPALSAAAIPPLDAEAARLLQLNVQRFSTVTRRLRVVGASVVDGGGALLFDNISLDAYRRRRAGSAWRVGLIADWMGTPLKGLRLAADLRLGSQPETSVVPVAHGTVWFWDLPLQELQVAGLRPAGQLQGSLLVTIRSDGSATARSAIKISRLRLSGDPLRSPTTPQDLDVDLAADFSAQKLMLRQITMRLGRRILFVGEGNVDQPYNPNPAVSIKLGNFSLDASQAKSALALVRDLPPWLVDFANRLQGGRLKLAQIALSTTLQELTSAPFAIFKNLKLAALLDGVEYALPAEFGLPALNSLGAQLNLSGGVLTVGQGHAELGNSLFSTLNARVDFSSGFLSPNYHVGLGGDASVSQLYPFAIAVLGQNGASAARYIERAEGMVAIHLRAEGDLPKLEYAVPQTFELTMEARHVELAFKGLPSPFTVVAGKLTWTPDEISVENLGLAARQGSADLSGEILVRTTGLEAHRLAIQLHQLPAEQWLPLVLSPNNLTAKGPVGGTITLRGGSSSPGRLSMQGRLLISPAEIGFGFLRAPVVVQAATLVLGGQSLVLDMPGATLEGAPLDLKVAVADLYNPAIRIDASATNLDLEVMRFVRLPWSPKGEVNFFGQAKAFGHVEALEANLEKLQMTHLSGDFTHDQQAWRVYNLAADTLHGLVQMELAGRQRDDWINIKVHSADLDLGALLMLSAKSRQAPVVGKLYSDLDLWGDADTDFFATLTGKGSVVVSDGTLNRFTLLSRLLDLINLKNWLTAKFPDPKAITGVPFKTLSASLSAKSGTFYTDDLRLDGPLLRMSAGGDTNVARSTLDFQVGIRPVLTVNTVINHIPIVGPRIESTGNILQAYFYVDGPIANPTVIPAPITSVAEAVKRTLFLPINIIRPNTIR